MTMQTATVNGIDITFEDTGGSGPAILFVHGNSSSGATFAAQLGSELAATFRLVSMDLPGHGHSAQVPVSEYSIPFYAKSVAALAATLGIERAVLLGWSLGGHVVLEAANLLPAARGFVIFGTPPLTCPPNMEQAFLPNPLFATGMTGPITPQQAADYGRSFLGDTGNDAIEATIVDDILATDPNARAGLAISAARPFVDEVELVAGLDRPIAVLHGGKSN